MTDTDCWILLEQCHDMALNDMELKSRLVREAIERLPEADAADMLRFFDAAMARCYTWPLWGAAYVMNGGCGDDTFNDFRACLISRGEAAVLGALKDPDTALADIAGGVESWFYQGFDSAIRVGVQAVLGTLPGRGPFPAEPAGEQWAEDEVYKLYPQLAELYG